MKLDFKHDTNHVFFQFFKETNSSLKKFLEDSLSMTPEERAKYLETYEVSIKFLLFSKMV